MNRHLLRGSLLFVVALGLLTACSLQPGTVEGTVTYAPDGQPAAAVQVSVYELEKVPAVTSLEAFQKGDVLQEATTAADGSFSFSLRAGDYLLQAQAEGYQPASYMLKSFAGGETATVNLSLIPAAQ